MSSFLNVALENCHSSDDVALGFEPHPTVHTAGIVSPMPYAVTLVCPTGYVHSLALLEIAETLNHALTNMGVDSILTDKFDEPGRCHIVLGAHLLSKFAMGPLKPDSIIYNFEQIDPDSPWLEESYLSLLRRHQVWDYSARNILLLQRQGVANIQHVPLGYVAQMERIKPAVQDIDVLFYGSINPRRQAVLDALMAAGLKVKQVFNYYGPPRDELIARSKIVLNMHYYESKIFEVARVTYLLTNGVCVVSETGNDPVEQDYADALAFAPYEGLVSTCLTLITNPQQRQAIARQGQEFIRSLRQELLLESAICTTDDATASRADVSAPTTPTSSHEKKVSKGLAVPDEQEWNASVTKKQYRLVIYVPTYNRASKLKDCLNIIAQQIRGHEDDVLVYVSNNGSTDHTTSVLSSFSASWLRVNAHQENKGFFLNIIRGYDLPVSADYVWIIGDDDYLCPDAIADLLELIRKHPEADYIFCNTKAYDHSQSAAIMSNYAATGEAPGGAIKSRYYVGTALIPFERLIDPKIADTLLGELMVGCFKQSKFHYPYAEAEQFNTNMDSPDAWDSVEFDDFGKMAQPHNIALINNLSADTLALYCDKPRTFNFWGSAEWLGHYDYVFPIIILYLIAAYKKQNIISHVKHNELLAYYCDIMKAPLLRQIRGTSTARPFNSKIKARIYGELAEHMLSKTA